MSRRVFHYLCIALLLFAQQSAIVHATWHAGGDAHAHEKPVDDRHAHDHGHDTDGLASGGYDGQGSQGSQGNLCAFDLAFGQVLGGAHGSCVVPNAAELTTVVADHTFNPRLGSEAVPAHSRGPPAFL